MQNCRDQAEQCNSLGSAGVRMNFGSEKVSLQTKLCIAFALSVASDRTIVVVAVVVDVALRLFIMNSIHC